MKAKEVIKEYNPFKSPSPDGNRDDMELFEMANLPQEDTGIKGYIYISSEQGKHRSRVKWYPTPPKSRRDPCLVVTIGPSPKAINLNLPQTMADAMAEPVRQWVVLNHVALQNFWNDGYSWTRQQVSTFIDELQKI